MYGRLALLNRTTDLARRVVDVLADRQADDIVLLDISQVANFADYFVIASGQSVRQIQAICDAIDEDLGREGWHPHHREGTAESGWVLLDFGDVIVHVFSDEQRSYYDLEGMWRRGITLLRIQ